jgi:type I restriction-modification system DNA methylase subunit
VAAPHVIADLVERFEQQGDAYKSGQYNEAQLRKEFVDPMFKALGWDMDNVSGYAEAYKDVIHEDAIKIGGATKAPDYCFRIGGTRKFFLEAKKPSIDIKHDASPAYQLRRYAWSAKLPLSILTDFEELAVYDCRVEPRLDDKASVARVLYLNFREYVPHWDDVAKVFARDAILKGSFDKFAESTKAKRGTAEVDDAFLDEIERWRADLARNLALRNPKLSQRDLNFSVQRTIDRIVFLRICEDRRIEVYGRLQALLNGENTYRRLYQLFREADQRYNSGLFYFQKEKDRVEPPDDLTPELEIDDSVLKKIIRRLYYPDSPYEFSVLPADILGQVYEQFLGKVIRLTEGHQAKIEDKPEVKKAGGVYYTPTYIVDYIVKNTVGKLLETKTPKQAAKLRILDPACGSGSFLIAAYQHLLNWHRDWYVADDPKRWATGRNPALYRGMSGEWKLTTGERKRILLQNIYGVDIDAQAVEVTKLSLLLKVLEGESEQTLATQLRFYHERALPDLGRNIKCGNSLIGSDFYQQAELHFPHEEERYRINAFDWNGKDGFPEIMKAGGFDAVIGNPPWISLTGRFRNEIHSEEEIRYLISHFQGNTYMPNMYEYFVAQGLNLMSANGWFSFIVPDRLGYNAQFTRLRWRILNETRIYSLLYKAPFPKVVADTLIFVVQKAGAPKSWSVTISEFGKLPIPREQHELLEHRSHAFEYFADESLMILVKAVATQRHVAVLGNICDSTSGFGGKSMLIHETRQSDRETPTLKGDSIGRYEFRKRYWFHFRKQNITGRTTDVSKLGVIPKILIRKTGDRIIAMIDDSGIFPEQSLYFLFNKRVDIHFKYLLGVLNSRLLTAYYRAKAITNKKSIAQLKKFDLDQLPIRTIDFSNPSDQKQHDQIVELVERMLRLHEQLGRMRTAHDKIVTQREIDATDAQIDKLVYELYGLTEEEIKIVEGSV